MKKFWMIFLFFALSPAQVFAAGNITVMQVSGQPQIIRGDKTIPAKMGTLCQTGDVLKTPTPECSLDVAVNGLAGCRVLPGSECTVVDGSKSNMRLEIKSGNAILNLKKLPVGSAFEIETPTAIASVRGTQFWGRVDAADLNNPITTFAVRRGLVNILDKKSNKMFSLKMGQALDIPKNGLAPVIRPALDEEMKTMEQAQAIQTSA